MREEIRDMLSRKRGAVVNIASAGGLTAAPSLAGYSASKHAVVGLTKTAAVEYAAAGIRVNAVCPGAIRTPMMDIAMRDPDLAVRVLKSPMARLGEPQEIADAALFLCSGRASFITGVPFPVDGGVLAH
jgi:NAD(P)-dependent dehydrogenase (short-subunit alcohol dehydrogenase family)